MNKILLNNKKINQEKNSNNNNNNNNSSSSNFRSKNYYYYDNDDKSEFNFKKKSVADIIIRSYDLPGELSKDDIRHDNDYINISDISIIPTRGEILCDRQPFLPSPIPD